MKLRIKEAMDPSVPSWIKATMKSLMKPVYRGRYSRTPGPSDFALKVDAANTVWHPMPVPRTSQEFNKVNKDPNQATVVHLRDDRDNDIVWVVGFNDGVSAKLNGVDKEISRHAAKNILPYIEDYGYLEFSDSLADLRKARQANRPEDDRRSHAQKLKTIKGYDEYDYELGTDEDGRWVKKFQQGPAYKRWETEKGFDKSGYRITGIEKYKEMLASIGLRNYDKTMDRIYDSYEGLTSVVRLCRGSRSKMQAYRQLVEQMARYFEDIDREYTDYLNTGEDSYSAGYKERYIKPHIEEYLKRLRDKAKKADEFVMHLTSDDWTDNDYDNFAWRL